jgi:integrase
MRPKSSARDLPPRMLRRRKKLKSGLIWEAYYYNGRDDDGKRIEIPLGSDLNEAKRKWAELECSPAPIETGLLKHIFKKYQEEIIPKKAPRTQIDNEWCMKNLKPVFENTHIDRITPQHIAIYRDKRSAKVRANREIALFSHIFNLAREWGYTKNENPCRGVRKNKEKPRDYYVSEETWKAVYDAGCIELQDAMNLAYLTGQRPADVLKMSFSDIRNGALEVTQGKTSKKMRIVLKFKDGTETELGKLIERIKSRPRKIANLKIIATAAGQPLNKGTLRIRFDKARLDAANRVLSEATDATMQEAEAFAARIRAFQFRDIRPKAASDIQDLSAASALLGHTEQEITRKVYIRKGPDVNPTR